MLAETVSIDGGTLLLILAALVVVVVALSIAAELAATRKVLNEPPQTRPSTVAHAA